MARRPESKRTIRRSPRPDRQRFKVFLEPTSHGKEKMTVKVITVAASAAKARRFAALRKPGFKVKGVRAD